MKSKILRSTAIAVVALIAAACSSQSPDETTLPESTTTPPAADGANTWVLLGEDPSEECPVDLQEMELLECRPASAANQEAYAAAMRAVGEYLLTAWEFPVRQNISDREAMAVWTGFLHPDADIAKWSAGPTYINRSAKIREDIPGDMRIALWKGNPDAPLDDRWYSDVTYHYVVTRLYPEYLLEQDVSLVGNDLTMRNPGTLPRVAIHRDGEGRLLGVYVPWGVEALYTLPEAGATPTGIAVVATAELRPLGDSDSDLRIVTPNATEPAGASSLLVGDMENVQSYLFYLTAPAPEDRTDNPVVVTPGVPVVTLDVDSYFLPPEE